MHDLQAQALIEKFRSGDRRDELLDALALAAIADLPAGCIVDRSKPFDPIFSEIAQAIGESHRRRGINYDSILEESEGTCAKCGKDGKIVHTTQLCAQCAPVQYDGWLIK